MVGTLYLVGTPIGNLGDLSDRARATLEKVDLVAAEDTRHSGKLLAEAGISTKSISYFEGNEVPRTDELVGRLMRGESVALVTDAGMPGVSDPGERLVRACVEKRIDVRVVPGPSAALAALVVSGLPMARFVFEGFFPRTTGKRLERMAVLAQDPRTVVIFESPRRAAATLDELGGAFGATRPAALCRELTKLYEEVLRGTLGELSATIAAREDLRGEIVIVIGGAIFEASEEEKAARIPDALVEAHALVEGGARPRQAAAQAGAAFGLSTNMVYRAMTSGDAVSDAYDEPDDVLDDEDAATAP